MTASAASEQASIDAAHFRRVMGSFATGVTVVTAPGPEGPLGMAANSFTSVSLDPPLVLFCPAKTSATWARMRAAGVFTVNVLGEGHEQLTRRFAARDADRFADLAYGDRPTGPALAEAVAVIECRLEDEVDAGDHTIVLGRVLAIDAEDDADPLVFHRGRYGAFRHI